MGDRQISKLGTKIDLNSTDFDAEYYVQDLLRKKGLEELVAVEQDMVNNVRRLDSEMQSLVYENYSKFLKATNTVKDMQSRLADTHDEIRDLSTRINKVTHLSENLTGKFAKNCENVKRLNEAKDSVKRLESLIKAPLILQSFVEKGEITKAVESYIKIKQKLERLKNIPSMAGITKDAEKIVDELKEKLWSTVKGRLISSEEVVEAITLLKQLGVPEQTLEEALLSNWEREMRTELSQLDGGGLDRFPDIFDFVDTGCCHFLTNLSLMASTFLQLFSKQTSKAELVQLLERTMLYFENILDARFGSEKSADCALFVKALDRIYRKISVLTRLSSGFNFTRMNAAMVQRYAKHQIAVCRQSVLESLRRTIKETLAKVHNCSPTPSSSISDNGRSQNIHRHGIYQDRKELLKRCLDKLEQSFVHLVKSSMASLLMFTANDIIFCSIPHFSPLFGFDVHEQIVVGSVVDLLAELQSRVEGIGEETEGRAIEVLILCTFLRNFQLKHLDYLMELCQEQYRLSEFHLAEQNKLTASEDLADKLKASIESLLRKFVEMESGTLIKMARRSIDVFDWIGCADSPIRVRTLTKHLMNTVEESDKDLGVFMDDGGLAKVKERTPVQGYSSMLRATSAASSIFNDASSVSSGGVVERLWGEAEPLEEGSAENAATVHVEFRRDVVLNALVRLLLRAMCDFVRNLKFTQQGLQQMQVDCAYIRQKLWFCVADEHMLNTCIEDVVTAAVNQCAQPKLLDPSVVRSICEET